MPGDGIPPETLPLRPRVTLPPRDLQSTWRVWWLLRAWQAQGTPVCSNHGRVRLVRRSAAGRVGPRSWHQGQRHRPSTSATQNVCVGTWILSQALLRSLLRNFHISGVWVEDLKITWSPRARRHSNYKTCCSSKLSLTIGSKSPAPFWAETVKKPHGTSRHLWNIFW